MASYCGIVTALEAYELVTRGGGTDFAQVIAACESFRPYCLIGDLAVNCYVEPVYTMDADIVITWHQNSIPANRPGSGLRIQFTTDQRYQPFVFRAEPREVFGIAARVACLEDVTQGKLWAYGDPSRRLSKRKKDELDLVRLAERYPSLKTQYPSGLLEQLTGQTGRSDD